MASVVRVTLSTTMEGEQNWSLCSSGSDLPLRLDRWMRSGSSVPSAVFLQVCLKYYEYEFMELACQCPAVVCCRCTPTQKAQIVRLLQERTGKLTCAVGELTSLRFHGVGGRNQCWKCWSLCWDFFACALQIYMFWCWLQFKKNNLKSFKGSVCKIKKWQGKRAAN